MKKMTPLKRELFMRGIKQVDVAMETGIPGPKLSMACNGRTELNEVEQERVAECVGVSVETLFPANDQLVNA